MGRDYCCVIHCKNTSKNSKFKFHKFPRAEYKLIQRNKWIAAVNRLNSDGSQWIPKDYEKICSSHFINNEMSENELNPSYIPTIFPDVCNKSKIDETAALNRHKRFMRRRTQVLKSSANIVSPVNKSTHDDSRDIDLQQSKIISMDQECQVNIFSDCVYSENTFTCNTYMYAEAEFCEAAVQTDIFDTKGVTTLYVIKKFKNKKCGTPVKNFQDQAVGPNEEKSGVKIDYFVGYALVKNDEQMSDLSVVSLNNFKFLLNRIHSSEKSKVTKENKLLIFLMKLKTTLSFSAISVLFGVHRTTISRIFFSVLEQLVSATGNLVFWPSKNMVQATMPQCFYPDYCNTRVIIDCTEFKIETPAAFDNRIFCYSHYKKGLTAKVLIGITPSGFICFKSKVSGGRKSDTQITIESGLLDLLQDGDSVLADKGFPNISTRIDQKGKKVLVIMPPFLQKKIEFTSEETEETYKVAKVRIHVERIMQRLKIYKILDKIPEYLFAYIDDVLHICCVLVNLQPPIFSNEENVSEENQI